MWDKLRIFVESKDVKVARMLFIVTAANLPSFIEYEKHNLLWF